MKELLLIKEKIKKFAGKYEVYLMPVFKFLLTFIALSKINKSMGYMELLTNKAIVLIIALAGSFLPVNLTIVILAVAVVAHAYAVSLVLAIVVLALFLVLLLLYLRFASEDSIGVLLTSLGFSLKLPYVMPVSMGLVGTPFSMVAVGTGVISFKTIQYIGAHAKELTQTDEEATMVEQFKAIVDGVIGNKAMITLAIAFMITTLFVYIIRRLAIKYCWLIAIVVGNIINFIVILAAGAKLGADIPAGGVFGGILISIILNIILEYFCFDLNYNKVEHVQYEDDEYYYYVKAIPKNTIKTTGKRSTSSAQPQRTAARPVANPATRPVAKTTQTSQSEQASSASHIRRAPLGLSGGRPAGEGRKLQEARQREAQLRNMQDLDDEQ